MHNFPQKSFLFFNAYHQMHWSHAYDAENEYKSYILREKAASTSGNLFMTWNAPKM